MSNTINMAKKHIATYPNALFNFGLQKGSNISLLVADVNSILKPLAFTGLTVSESNEIDNIVTDHNSNVYNNRMSGNVVAEKTLIAEPQPFFPIPQVFDRHNLYVDEYINEDPELEDDFDEDEFAQGDFANYQEDLNTHQVPGILAEQARRTQIINDETIYGKMSEYHMIQGGHYSWNAAMVNLLVEAAMIASGADHLALVADDSRTRIIPGYRGDPTAAVIVDTNGHTHDLIFIDHKLQVANRYELDINGNALLDRANRMLIANAKRQVLEIVEALRFVEPVKKSVLTQLGDIVSNVGWKGNNEEKRELEENRDALRESVATYIPSAKDLARHIGEEIRGMETAIAL